MMRRSPGSVRFCSYPVFSPEEFRPIGDSLKLSQAKLAEALGRTTQHGRQMRAQRTAGFARYRICTEYIQRDERNDPSGEWHVRRSDPMKAKEKPRRVDNCSSAARVL